VHCARPQRGLALHNPGMNRPLPASVLSHTAAPLPLSLHAATDVGRLRLNNEDAVAVDPALGLAVLADGMGGYQAGEVASQMTVQILQATLRERLAALGGSRIAVDLPQALAAATDAAVAAVYEAANTRPELAGMGTTLVVALAFGTRLWVGHIGDSRAYRWRDGRLKLLTRDHSLLQEQLDAGVISPVEARHAAHRNLVTRAIGVELEVELELHAHDLAPRDLILLCSDGLTDMLADDELALLLAGHDGAALPELAQACIDAANAAGGRDNIAVALLRAHAPVAGRAW